MKKPFPKFKNNAEFKKFFEKADLSEYIETKDLHPTSFRLKKQDRVITLRLSSALVSALKKAAEKHQTQYQRLIRYILEENIAHYLR